MRPGFGATTRRTSGDSALGTPGVRRGGAATGSSSFTYDTPSAASRASVRMSMSGSGIVHGRAARRVVAGEDDALAPASATTNGRCSSSRGTRSSAAKQRVRRREARECLETAHRRQDQLDLAARVLTQRVDRAHPGGRDQLAVVVHTVLTVG